MALNDDIFSRTLRHRALLTMYEKRLESEIDKLLVSHNLRMRLLIRKGNLANTQVLLKQLEREIRSTYRIIYRMAITELNQLAGVSARFTKATLSGALRNIYKARGIAEGTTINDLIIRGNGNFGNQVTKISINERRAVNNIVRNGIAARLSTTQIVTNIGRTGTSLARAQLTTLARTAITETSSFIADETYKLNSDVIRGYQYVATLDSRTSIICARLDGQVFNENTTRAPKPPQHFGCRSTTIPIVKSAGELQNVANNRLQKRNLSRISTGRRASINGQVPARLTYQEWLTTQPNDVKLTLLGSQKRVTIFNQGNLSLRSFSNREGRLVTIDKLEELSNI